MLEIGIGTNHLDVPSTMGVTGVPGASLRAWRELLPLAAIVGADVDERILFQDHRIETYAVDQTRPETIDALMVTLGEQKLDLLVDDGLHTFEANLNVFRHAYPKIRKGGLFIVEDVQKSDVPRWENLLGRSGHLAAIIRPPHATNMNDNCIVVVEGGHYPEGLFTTAVAAADD
ncbi:MAG: hypothetical protein QM753_11575 [Thermomicrobiales bacterium]